MLFRSVNGDVAGDLRAFYDGEMSSRRLRPLGSERETHLAEFVRSAGEEEVRSVIEVGCGAGRDGVRLQDAGLAYTGVDLSPVAVRICQSLGLAAFEALATRLPFGDDVFDSAWSMSTLMHLPGDDFATSLDEIRRVVRPGGLVEIGVWGHASNVERVSPDGRYFNHRSDESLRKELGKVGAVVAFDTWDWFADGRHYQWARIVVPGRLGPTRDHA